MLDHLLQAEIQQREEWRIRTSLRLLWRDSQIHALWGYRFVRTRGVSLHPSDCRPANFDFGFQSDIEKSRIETVATCVWIGDWESVVLWDPSGAGATTPDSGAGREERGTGFLGRFLRPRGSAERPEAGFESSAGLRLKHYMKLALLIIDEIGLWRLSRAGGGLRVPVS